MNASNNFVRRLACGAVLAMAMAIAIALPARAHDSGAHASHGAHDAHAGHAASASAAGGAPVRTTADYKVATVKLVRADGLRVDFPAALDDGRPVMMNFVYTTCTAICPAMTQIFAEVQKQLGADAAKLQMVSLSIDPEQDTPRRLAEYAKAHAAGPDWRFYTGTVEASIAVQKSLAAYRGDKMNHTPLTLLRAAPGQPWVRLDGFATPDQLLREVRAMLDPR